MGTRTGQSILDRCWIKAKDEGVNKRWSADEGLLWVNDAALAVVSLVPRAYTQSAVVAAEPGVRQTMAGLGLTRGLQPIDVPNNVSASGAPGSSLRKVKRIWLDDSVPNWHAAVADEAQHWMTDDEDPTSFYIYPAIGGGGQLRVIHSATPPELTSLAQAIPLQDVYAEPMQHYVLFCFYSKDLTSIKSTQLAQMHLTLFERFLGARDQQLNLGEAKANAKQKGA
jgi:hypothetical protein